MTYSKGNPLVIGLWPIGWLLRWKFIITAKNTMSRLLRHLKPNCCLKLKMCDNVGKMQEEKQKC